MLKLLLTRWIVSATVGLVACTLVACTTDPEQEDDESKGDPKDTVTTPIKKDSMTTRQPRAGSFFKLTLGWSDSAQQIMRSEDIEMRFVEPRTYKGRSGVAAVINVQDFASDTGNWSYLQTGDVEIENSDRWERYPLVSRQWYSSERDTITGLPRTIEQAVHNLGVVTFKVGDSILNCETIVSERIIKRYNFGGSLFDREVNVDTTWFSRSIGFPVRGHGYKEKQGEGRSGYTIELTSFTLY